MGLNFTRRLTREEADGAGPIKLFGGDPPRYYLDKEEIGAENLVLIREEFAKLQAG